MSASARGIRAGKAFVELFADDSRMQQTLKQAQARINRFADEVRKVGMGLAAIGGTITAVFAVAARQFAGFDDSMRTVGAVTGATAQQMAMLREEAQRLGRTTSFTAKQVADAMTEMGRAGFVADEIMRSTDSVLALARATSTELPQATQIAGAVLRGFAMDAAEMPRIADVLTATANMSAQTLSDLGEAMKVVAPLAVEAGESIEDVSAAVGILANNGIRGSMAGNSLARAYKNLSTEAKQAELRDIGVQAVDAAGDLRPLADILNDVADAVAEFGSARRLSIFESLFGRGQAAAMKLAGDGKAVRDLTDAIRAAGGVAEKTAEQMDAGLGGSFRKMMSAAEGVAIAVGDAIAGPLGKLADLVTDIAGRVTGFVENNKLLVVTIAAVGAGLLALGTTLISVAALVKVFTVALGGAALAAKVLGAALTLLSAHPIIGALTLIAAGAVAVAAALGRSGTAAERHAAKLDELHQASAKQRDVDQQRIERLRELSKEQELSIAQMREAANLIKLLEGNYGRLNIELDKTAKQLRNVGEGQEQVNREMLKQQFAEKLDAMEARREIIANIERQIGMIESGAQVARFDNELRSEQALTRLREQLEKELAHLERINQEIIDLRGGGQQPEAAPSQEPDPGGFGVRGGVTSFIDDGRGPDEPVAEAEQWLRRIAQLRIQLGQEGHARDVALVNERYEHELARAGQTAEDIARLRELSESDLEHARSEQYKIELARRTELAALEKRAAEEAAGVVEQWQQRVHALRLQQIEDEHERDAALINQRYDQEIARAAGNADAIAQIEKARELELENLREDHRQRAKAHADAIAASDQSRSDRVAELEIRATVEDEFEQTMKILDLREQIALRAAEAAGENLDLVREEYAWLRQIAEQRRRLDAATGGVESVGALGGQRIEQMVGGKVAAASKAEDRTAKATETVAKATPQIVSSLRDMATSLRQGTSGVFA